MTKLVAAGAAGVLILVIVIWCFSGLIYATEGERVVALKWGKIQQVIDFRRDQAHNDEPTRHDCPR